MKIKKRELQYRLGLFLVGSHVWLIALLLVSPLISRLTFEEIQPAMSIILPVSGVYVGAVIEFSISNRYMTSKKSPPMNPMFAVLALSVPILFVLSVTALIVMWGFHESVDSDLFRTLFTALESGLGISVGFIVTALFREGRSGQEDSILTIN